MEGAKYVHALSLGTSCFPAAYLRDRTLRCYAGPFDWIFSSPRVVSLCLQDDFDSFLDVAQYQDCGQVGRAGHQLFSKLLGKATIFNHHDPRIPEHHDYFCRAVDRFRSVLATPANKVAKVFLVCSLEVGFHLNETELFELFQQLCIKTSGFALVAVRLAHRTHDDASLPQVTLQAHEENEFGTLYLYNMVLRGAHEGLSLGDKHDREAFDRLLQPWFDGHVPCSDPLERCIDTEFGGLEQSDHMRLPASSVPPFEDESSSGHAFAAVAFEIVCPPRDGLSPDLKPVSLDCKVVLKESVGQRVLRTLAGQSGKKDCGGRRCRRMTITANMWVAANGVAEAIAHDEFGCTPALLVLTEALLRDNGGEICIAVGHFLKGGPGIRAALLPEEAVAVLRTSGFAVAAVPRLRFPKEYDLFRLVDPSRVVSGGMCVRKAPSTTGGFTLVISSTRIGELETGVSPDGGAKSQVFGAGERCLLSASA